MTQQARQKILGLAVALFIAAPSVGQDPSFPSYHPGYPPPPDWPGPVFDLSQAYPKQPPARERVPWSTIDFQQEPMEYLRAVLAYALEGNVEVDFRGQDNSVRKWYHSPWMQTGCGGREFIHGLTRERRSRPYELHPDQKDWVENWAVGLYNPPGGHVVGRFWDGGLPNRSRADFPDGTVALKLLFSAADPQHVPFLRHSYSWSASIYDNSRNNNPCALAPRERPRAVRDLRLLQVDVAVRDERSRSTGWVFGTFIYSAAAPGDSPFDRLVPVGLSWGDDSQVLHDFRREGVFINRLLQQSALNRDLLPPSSGDWGNRAYVTHFGLGGRLNGPVDNAVSSCISCHARASVPAIRTVPSGVTRAKDYTPELFEQFFATVGQGPRRGPNNDYIHSDYSLQLAFGAQNFLLCRRTPGGEGCPASVAGSREEERPADLPLEPGVLISRDGDE